MKIDVLSLFPEMFDSLRQSMIGKALEKGIIDFKVTNFRDYTLNKQKHVDDLVYGGGAGMLLTPQPIFSAMSAIEADNQGDRGHVILVDPAGKRFDHQTAQRLSKYEHLTFISGHYEGYDNRIRQLVDEEISLGDYVLTGGELPTMVIIDATVRFLDDVLGNADSAADDSFQNGLLEEPQYTRPADFQGMKVPDVLISGDHEKIRRWRLKESLRRTYLRRPDLLVHKQLTNEERDFLDDIKYEESLDSKR
ncbi:tRNA (guanosine(37)-N1)-methyltransferase TrmD [Oenococcus sp.]|uniref:tRNA (guanosine(37)-N1)-methyltransferase TrmD n=1 Tax=Oenococcus sp. TaxID=1979414 RepID=UPI0039E8BB4F